MFHPKSIFFTGATGYVGGSLLVSLVKKYPATRITALVRSSEDLDAVSAVGATVDVVLGSHADQELIIRAVSEAELVFQVSYPDDLEMVQAIISGLKLHKEKTGKRALYFHTTGTMTYADEASGELKQGYEVWDDTDKIRLKKTIDVSAPHRMVDLETMKAHDENVADVYIICPPIVYGLGIGPVRRINGQITHVVRYFLETNHAACVGKGTNIWSNIHVCDLVQAILIIVDHAILAQKDTPEGGQTIGRDGFDNFYFASAGQCAWGPIIKEMARIMFQRGLLESSSTKSVSGEHNRLLSWNAGTNCWVRSTRLEALGWRPKEKGIMDNIEETVEASLQLIKSGRVLNFWPSDY